jgi:hypothetical protein
LPFFGGLIPVADLGTRNRRRKPWLWVTATIALLIAVFAIGLWRIASAPPVVPVRAAAIRSAPPPKSAEQVLAPLNGASGVARQGGIFESFAVDYTLKKGYPPKGVIEEISSRLQALNWRPLDHDWLHPKAKSSNIGVWCAITDVTDAKAPLQLLWWQAQWENDAGDLVCYTFSYSYPAGAPAAQQTLSVEASWYPAAGRTEKQRTFERMHSTSWHQKLREWLRQWLRL